MHAEMMLNQKLMLRHHTSSLLQVTAVWSFQCGFGPCECVRVQASPESLFEATLAEGVPFKVKAAVTDPSGFHAEGEPLELEFRYLHHLAFLK